MKIVKGLIATTHRDSHGETIDISSLETLVEKIKIHYIPINYNHDPRIPPLGRIRSANIIKLEDNNFGVEAEMEIFEEADNLFPFDSTKEIYLRKHDINLLEVMYDRSYKSRKNQKLVKDVANLLNSKPREEIKKALEPISIIMIIGGFIISSIAAGFLTKLGSDSFDKLKELLKKHFNEKRKKKEQLLNFEFTLYNKDKSTNVLIIISNPTPMDIELFFTKGINNLDNFINQFIDEENCVREIVVDYKKGKFKILYGVRSDGAPMYPRKNA